MKWMNKYDIDLEICGIVHKKEPFTGLRIVTALGGLLL